MLWTTDHSESTSENSPGTSQIPKRTISSTIVERSDWVLFDAGGERTFELATSVLTSFICRISSNRIDCSKVPPQCRGIDQFTEWGGQQYRNITIIRSLSSIWKSIPGLQKLLHSNQRLFGALGHRPSGGYHVRNVRQGCQWSYRCRRVY